MKVKTKRVDPKELKLLEVNARFMRHEEFQKLVNNVKKDGALTSVPFCCLDDDGKYLVLSGNHRVQAAIEAGFDEILIMYTDDKLSQSQKIAIQLSHNSICGEDDAQTLKELYEAIDDFDYKMYSGLDDKTLELLEKVSSESMSAYNLEYQVLSIVFLPEEIKDVAKIIKMAKQEVGKNKALIARYSEYDSYLETMDEIASAKNIRNVAATFYAMLEIVKKHVGELKEDWIADEKRGDKGLVPISTVLDRHNISIEDAKKLDRVIEKMVSSGKVKKSEKHRVIGILCDMYTGESKKK